MNILTIIGRLGRDPETKQTQSGVKITTLAIADNVTKDDVIWWRCTIFGSTAERILPHLKKGSALIVQGKQKKPKIFDRKDGTQDVSCEMIVSSVDFAPFKSSESEEPQNKSYPQGPYGPAQQPQQQQQQQGAYQAGQAQYTQPPAQPQQNEFEDLPF